MALYQKTNRKREPSQSVRINKPRRTEPNSWENILTPWTGIEAVYLPRIISCSINQSVNKWITPFFYFNWVYKKLEIYNFIRWFNKRIKFPQKNKNAVYSNYNKLLLHANLRIPQNIAWNSTDLRYIEEIPLL